MWKRLHHPNLVPLLGITSTPLQLISEWMPGGDLMEHIENHPDTDRLGLVGVLPPVLDHRLTHLSYAISPTVFTTSTSVTWFMGISRRYVVIQNLILLQL